MNFANRKLFTHSLRFDWLKILFRNQFRFNDCFFFFSRTKRVHLISAEWDAESECYLTRFCSLFWGVEKASETLELINAFEWNLFVHASFLRLWIYYYFSLYVFGRKAEMGNTPSNILSRSSFLSRELMVFFWKKKKKKEANCCSVSCLSENWIDQYTRWSLMSLLLKSNWFKCRWRTRKKKLKYHLNVSILNFQYRLYTIRKCVCMLFLPLSFSFSEVEFIPNNECETGDCTHNFGPFFFCVNENENLHWKLDGRFDSSSARLLYFIDLMFAEMLEAIPFWA